MVNPVPFDDAALNEALSALADGHATPADWARVEAAWAHDPALRERWALWHAAGDGLRSVELPAAHRDPEALLAALQAQLPAPAIHPRRRLDWFAPLAVAAGFVVMALGLGTLRAPSMPAGTLAGAQPAMPQAQAQALAGTSFAQAAAGRTVAALGATREPALLFEAPPDVIDWGMASPASAPLQATLGSPPH